MLRNVHVTKYPFEKLYKSLEEEMVKKKDGWGGELGKIRRGRRGRKKEKRKQGMEEDFVCVHPPIVLCRSVKFS